MQQNIVLRDELAELAGGKETHTYYNLRSPAEAIKLLCINYPKLQRYLETSHEIGVAYTVVQAKEFLDVEDLKLPLGSKDLVITPVVVGAGNVWKGVKRFFSSTVGKIIVGIALVTAAIVFAPAGTALLGGLATGAGVGGAAAWTAGLFGAMAWAGVALIAQGVNEIVNPVQDPKKTPRFKSGDFLATDGPQSATRGADGRASYAYGGASNNVGVGATVPLAYGQVLIGSHLASAQIEITNESDPLSDVLMTPGFDTVRIGGDRVNSYMERLDGLYTRSFRTYRRHSSQGYNVNETIELDEGDRDTMGTVRGEEPDDDKYDVRKFEILFELPDGLFKLVSGAGSTKVPGFITYKIEVFNWEDDSKPLVGAASATIQGLLYKSHNFRWAHQFTFQKISGVDDYKVKVTVIDFSGESKTQPLGYKHYMKCLAMGYKFKYYN